MAEQPNILHDTITVTHGNETFVFRIPSLKDRMKISSLAAKLRRETDPDGMGLAMGYDAGSSMLFEAVASFMTLVKEAPPRWLKPDAAGNPIIDLDNMTEDTPVMEVMNQFYIELDKFRASMVQS